MRRSRVRLPLRSSHLALLLALLAPGSTGASAQSGAPAAGASEFTRLNDASVAAFEQGNLAQAIEHGERALAAAERLYGRDAVETLTAASNLGRYRLEQGDVARAEPLLVRALQGLERLRGRDDPATIGAVGDVALLYRTQGRFAEAEPLFRRAVEAGERVLGPDNDQTIIALTGLGELHYSLGRYDEAEPLLRSAMERSTRALGADSPATLLSASRLGELLRARGRFAEAEPLLRRTLQSAERAWGRDRIDTLNVVEALGLLYQSQGRIAQAEPLLARAYRGAESALGTDDPQTLAWLSNLAQLYVQQARFGEAETMLRRALETSERVLGRDHPGTLLPANNLAAVYVAQGRYGEAEPLFQRVVEGRQRALGADHPDTALALGNLGTIYLNQERYADAEPYFERAIAASERSLGPDNQNTLTFVNNLALVYRRQARLAEAEPLYRRVVTSLERTGGDANPLAITALGNLAALYDEQRRDADAERLYRRVVTAAERSLGRDHPNRLSLLINLASLYYRQNRFAEAEPLAREALEANNRVFGSDHPATVNAASYLAMARLAANNAAGALDAARLAAAGMRSRRISQRDDVLASAAQAQAQSRESVLFTLLADSAWAAGSPRGGGQNPLGAEAFTALQDATAGITDQAVVRMAVRRFADDRAAGLGALVRERETLENRWAVNNADYTVILTNTDADSLASRQQLRTERTQIESRTAEIDQRLRREFPEYFDLVHPQAVDLPTAAQMLADDEAILLIVPTPRGTHSIAVTHTGASWVRSEATEEQIDGTVARLLLDLGANVRLPAEEMAEWQRQHGQADSFDRNLAYALYQHLIAPVAPLLAGKRHVFIAASGALTSLPFGVLVTEAPQGRDSDPAALRATPWFADAHALVQIPSVQALQFLRRYRTGAASGRGFVGFGDPVLGGQAVQRGVGRAAAVPEAQALFGDRRSSSGLRLADVRQLNRLDRLPGTAVELERMRTALRAPASALFLGPRASEATLRSMDLSNVRILALATHGVMAGEMQSAYEPGLVLTPPATPSDQDDGLLTTSEVAALRLNADWVILSACNTAAGDGSEGAPGLSGLARAFFYAGARNLLASHWPVRDDVAPRLTVRTISLQQEQPGLSRAEAFQHAMREIRNDASHDAAGDTWAHPKAWAPFTLIGDGAH
jgi:CHAT domain-containing protein/tetratricopeptide (TPR) repeat protein